MANAIIVHANFWDDVRVQMLNALTAAGAKLEARDQADVKKVCMAFFTLQQRIIAPRVRATHRSRELEAKFSSLPPELQAGVQLVEAKALAGDHLEEHFSHKARRPYSLPDWLLNDWGIHHLHVRHNQGYELLFVCAEESDLYLVDVLDHDAMAELELLEIILRNWPSLLRVIPGLRGAAPGGVQTTAKELDEARRAGVQPLLTLSDGKLYGPRGGGLTTAGGSSGWAVTQMHRALKRARFLEELCREHGNRLGNALGRSEIRLRYNLEMGTITELETGEVLDLRGENDD